MKKLLSIFSIFTISASQVFASTFIFSKLSKDEQAVISEKYNNALIQYDESTDEIIIDEALERELREGGVLKTEDVKKGTACIGDN